MSAPRPPDGRTRGGHVTGSVFRAARDRLGATQEELAEALQVDKNTIQGWESARRPLTARRAGDIVALRRHLLVIGAPRVVLDQLDLAIEADWFLQAIIGGNTNPDTAAHPLATWVNDREFTRMVGWAFRQAPPAALAPVSNGPQLSAEERARFFAELQRLAERSLAGDSTDPVRQSLLRQQVYFMLAWQGAEAVSWLSDQERAERRQEVSPDSHSPQLIITRSIAIHRATQGDPDPLRWHIAHTLDDDRNQAMDLNYWAHWTGETGTAQSLAEFSTPDIGPWPGTRLYAVLVDDLATPPAYVDLCIHSLWSLVQRRPLLLQQQPEVTARMLANIETLQTSDALSEHACGQLAQLHYAAAMAQPRRGSA